MTGEREPLDTPGISEPSQSTGAGAKRRTRNLDGIGTAYVWLAIFAVISALLEMVYLTSPVPYTVAIAFAFTMVLSRTSRLWTTSRVIAAIPLGVWLGVVVALVFIAPTRPDILLPWGPRVGALIGAGVCGGLWPLITMARDNPDVER